MFPKNYFIIIAISLIFVMPQAFADTQNLHGNSHGYDISLVLDNNKVSGIITSEKHTINFDNVKIIERKSGFLIINNDLKILTKQINSEKYLVLVKINSEDIQTKFRFIAISEHNTHKNTTQRNLFDAMKYKQTEEYKEKIDNMTFKELELLEKQKEIDDALKVHEDRLKKIAKEEANKPHGDKTSQSILDEWKKFQIKTGTDLVVKEKTKEIKQKEKKAVSKHDEIKVFLSVPHHQEWKKTLRYNILVTDDSGHRYDSSYDEYVGNKLSNVTITGKIKNPTGSTIQSFNGTSNGSGEYLGTFLIPDKSTTRGEYVIAVDAVKTFDDKTTAKSSTSDTFFVFASSDGSFNDPPVANAGIDQHLPTGDVVTLSGSQSSDPDDNVIFYTWSQTSGTDVTFNLS